MLSINKSTTSSFPLSPKREMFFLFLLAFIQFTHIVDFMIMMPLGPQFIRLFNISTKQFGLMVSAYTFSAGACGLLAAFFLDRFDRKKVLLILYTGFGLGTLACALAPTYGTLTLARIIAGGFGGVTGSTVLAMVGDAIPFERRGKAMGLVMMAFSIASILGVPLGLLLANHYGWHMPFFVLAAVSVVVLIITACYLPPMIEHLNKVEKNPVAEMKYLLSQPRHWMAFGLTITMTYAGFSIIPYISPYMVANVGLTEHQLPWIYTCGGFFTFFSMPWIGKLSDKFGLLKVFTWVTLFSAFPMLLLTLLPQVPLFVAITVTTFFMVLVSGRFVPGMAMAASAVEAKARGGFMSMNSSLQQFASGFAAYFSGLILVKTSQGPLLHYGMVGVISVLSLLLSLFFAVKLGFKKPRTSL